MWTRPITRLVSLCGNNAAPVTTLLLLLSLAAIGLAATRLGINTDTRDLINPELPWRQQERRLQQLFPQLAELTIAIVRAPTQAEADDAARRLTAALQADQAHFTSVVQPEALPFFEQHGLLYLAPDELQELTLRLIEAQPLLGVLSADPSARGLAEALGLALDGAAQGGGDIAGLLPAFEAIDASLRTLADPAPRPPDWAGLLTGQPSAQGPGKALILVRPVLDLAALEPGGAAAAALRAAGKELGLTGNAGVELLLTGPVPLTDEEFASVREGAGLSGAITVAGVLLLLVLGLRSFRLVLVVTLTLFAGLAVTFGFAALAFGTLNLISVAFAVLFVGLGVDFGIQFAVRFGDERQQLSLMPALEGTAQGIGGSLTLAALATALGFLAFAPTDFRGVAELGMIAGFGMLVALCFTLTLLPALIRLLGARPRTGVGGQPWAAPLDRFLHMRRYRLRTGYALLGAAAAIIASQITFDADPLALKDPHSPSMQALDLLLEDPAASPYTANLLVDDPTAAATMTSRLEALPEVASVLSPLSFVPEQQEEKLTILEDAAFLLGPVLDPTAPASPPDDDALRRAFSGLADRLAATAALPEDLARPLAARLAAIATAPPAELRRAAEVMLGHLPAELARLRASFGTLEPVGIADLPQELARDWIAPDGTWRVMAVPSGDPRQPATLQRFVASVRTIAPDVTGDAVTLVEAGRTVANAFLQALGLAAAAMTVLLFLVLRRVRDTLLVMLPLLLAALLTAAIWVLLGRQMNFANVIALPLMLGIGVAFNIYFVVNWRKGGGQPLQSSLARAVVFSALTTMTAFGSLALSPHRGTASMGELLTLSLSITLLTTLLVLPALLSPPPRAGGHRSATPVSGEVAKLA